LYERIELRHAGDKRLALVFTYERIELDYMSTELQWRRIGDKRLRRNEKESLLKANCQITPL
jgi:hypothetical protein